MRRIGLGLVLLLCGSVLAPLAAAHAPGSGTVSTSGSFVLTPGYTLNSSFHAYLSTLGLPIGPGDVLVWSWSANAARGPPIYFEIHAHPGSVGYVQYYNITADKANNSWSVPGSDAYMVLWTNPNTVTENVTYTFQLIPPPLELWPLYLLLVAPLVMVGALVWYARRRQKRSKRAESVTPRADGSQGGR